VNNELQGVRKEAKTA